jgi:hypothetical protein
MSKRDRTQLIWLASGSEKTSEPVIFFHHNDVFAVGVLAYFDGKK